jgi:hypothetical protein
MFTGIATIVLFTAQPIPKAEVELETGQLVVKGKDFLIHAFGKLKRPGQSDFPATTTSSESGVMLVHTSFATGKMTVLARGGSASWRGPPMGLDRIYYAEAGVLDYRADKERLYVLHYSLKIEGRSGFVMRGDLRNCAFRLLVFRLEDGKQLHALEVKRPEKAPGEKSDKGPLRLIERGVEVFEAPFEFKGTELIKPALESKK